MSTPREQATAVLLADGRVLVIGGYDASNGVNLQTSEIYDPDSGQFSQVATMPGGGRSGATATLLTNGKVLIAGGYNGNYLASALIYSPDSNTYTPTASMGTARSQAGAVLLPSGKVLLVGGQRTILRDIPDRELRSGHADVCQRRQSGQRTRLGIGEHAAGWAHPGGRRICATPTTSIMAARSWPAPKSSSSHWRLRRLLPTR
ncbi:MAG: hypothetical protein IPH43_02075 [Xanthomonadales bacterium]|nr:hypothetical protein [Xanthomonadales bacterium]